MQRWLGFLLWLGMAGMTYGGGSVTLDGYGIVTSAAPTVQEALAATELKDYLEKITRKTFEVTSEPMVDQTASGRKNIYIGHTRAWLQTFPQFDLSALGSDGIALKHDQKGNIFLAGGKPRGTLYAVYTFLEDYCGVRWWTAQDTHIPAISPLTIRCPDLFYIPKFSCREVFARGAFDGIFAVRLKCNGHFENIPAKYGGHYHTLGWCHTFYQLLPPAKYFKSHPEWYSEINGKRVGRNAQLCLSNVEMRHELTNNALQWLRRHPDAQMISISQNDCDGFCRCAACRRAEQADGTPSGPLLQFVNVVAAEIEKEYPKVWVETLAYQATRHAPAQVKPRRNVVIRLCSIDCAFSQPFTGSQNRSFAQDVETWSRIAPRLLIWDYVTNFSNYLLPHPNWDVLAANLRFLARFNVCGVFEQGDAGSTCGDFIELRIWLLAHLLWNPQRDEKALIGEFLRGYYGAAAEPLQQYLELLERAGRKSEVTLRCYSPDAPWLDLTTWRLASKYFAVAEAAVKNDPILSRRVRKARVPLDFAWLVQHDMMRWQAVQEKRYSADDPADLPQFTADFIKAVNSFGGGQAAEGVPFKEIESWLLRKSRRSSATVPASCVGLPDCDWFDNQDCDFRLYGEGKLCRVVADLQASDGQAVKMPGTHAEWAVQLPVSAQLKNFHAYVVVRCETKSGYSATGPAFSAGSYEAENKSCPKKIDVTLEQAGSGYRIYDLGRWHGHRGYLWVAPRQNPNLAGIFVDRIFWVKNGNPRQPD